MTNPSGIIPLDMRVLVKPDPVEEVTAGGIWKPDMSKEREKYAGTRATLIAYGPNAFKEWGEGNGIEPGARVHYAQYTGARIKGEDGEDYVIMNDADLTAVIEAARAVALRVVT
jgi:chaperonin GroES